MAVELAFVGVEIRADRFEDLHEIGGDGGFLRCVAQEVSPGLPVAPQYWSFAGGVNALSRLNRYIWTKQRCEILYHYRGHLSRGNRPHAGDDLRNSDHVRRLVALSSVGSRRKVRRIGLDQEPIGRHHPRDLAQFFRAWKRHDSGQRNEEAYIEHPPRHRGIAGKTVKDPADYARATTSQDVERVVGGLPRVNDHGQSGFNRQADLRVKNRPLNLAWREVIVIVESDLPNSPGLLCQETLADGGHGVGGPTGEASGIVRMDANGEAHIRPDCPNARRGSRLRWVTRPQDAKGAGDTCLLRAADHPVEIAGKRSIGEMTVTVDHLYRTRVPGAMS